MKMKQAGSLKLSVLCLFLVLICTVAVGQTASKEDIKRVNKLLRESQDTAETNMKRAIIIAQMATDLSEKTGYMEGMVWGLLRTGGLSDNLGNSDSSLEMLQHALKICKDNQLTKMEGAVQNTLGGALAKRGETRTALSYFIAALASHRLMNDSNGMAVSYTNIGTTFMELYNFPEAIKNYDKAIELYRLLKARKASRQLAKLYTNLGNVYASSLNQPEGLPYLYQAIDMFNDLHDTVDMSMPFSILAGYFEHIKRLDSALFYLEKGLKIAVDNNDKKMEAVERANIGGLYMDMEKYGEAERYYVTALVNARQAAYGELTYEIQKSLASIAAKRHDYKRAFEYDDSAYANRDSFWIRQKEKDVAEMTARYNNTELENKNALLKKENDIKQIKLQRKNVLIYSGFGAAILFLVIAYQVVRHNKLLANQKLLEVEQKQLLAQMNPHFIFNCLNSIQQYVVMNDAENANKYLADFALLMRQTLDNSKDGIIPLQREIDYLENYLSLECMRFENKFTYSIICSEGVNKNTLEIPSMIIQPFVENAIHHGLRNLLNEDGWLHIRFYKNGGHLYCEVDDNGIGMEESKRLKEERFLQYQSHGMELTRQRLELVSQMNSTEYEITVVDKKDENQAPGGTTIIIKFPMKA